MQGVLAVRGRTREPQLVTRLTPEQIAKHAYDAGFRGEGLTTAVAVALAESSGRTGAHNDTPPDDSYGLWQINMLGSLGPARRRQFDLDANKELLDPAVNAKAAYSISGHGKNWQPWSTYTNGAYRRHLDEARRAARAVTERGRRGGDRGRDGDRRRDGRSDRGRGADTGGYLVDPDALGGYVRRTRNIADELARVNAKHVRGVRSIADDSFGKIGKESGFAAALDGFGEALQRQVKGVGANADRLATAVGRSAKTYREQEEDITAELNRLLNL